MGAPQSPSNAYNAIQAGDDESLQLPGLNKEEEELGATSSIESSYVVSNSSHDLHISDKNKNRKRSTWPIRRSAQQQQKIARRSKHKKRRLARLSSTVPNATECTDEESILKEAIAYVQGLQKQLKDIKADIALLQINISATDTK
jgi:hypothetical protein